MARKKKVRYPQICDNHPNRTEDLYYVYTGGKGWRLLCEECRDDEFDAHRIVMGDRYEMDAGEGKVLDLPKDNSE